MESDGPSGRLSDTERAVHGDVDLPELSAFLTGWAMDRLGSSIASVRFRAGRIDAVWGVDLHDGRAVVIKAHRLPADLDAIGAARDAQQILVAAGFPAPEPLAGPDQCDGRVLSAESLVVGERPDGRDLATRALLAQGLAHHIDLLRGRTDLLHRVGRGPSWCQYQDGPWPVPHDTMVDLVAAVEGYRWLDTLARRASEQILDHRAGDRVVVGHADWYAGNTVVVDGRLAGVFDWQLVADTEAVIAGFAASCYASSATGGGGLSQPDEVAGFLLDYERARGRLTDPEWRAAAGAATWILAFNARWQVALIEHGISDASTIEMVRRHQEDYLGLSRA